MSKLRRRPKLPAEAPRSLVITPWLIVPILIVPVLASVLLTPIGFSASRAFTSDWRYYALNIVIFIGGALVGWVSEAGPYVWAERNSGLASAKPILDYAAEHGSRVVLAHTLAPVLLGAVAALIWSSNEAPMLHALSGPSSFTEEFTWLRDEPKPRRGCAQTVFVNSRGETAAFCVSTQTRFFVHDGMTSLVVEGTRSWFGIRTLSYRFSGDE